MEDKSYHTNIPIQIRGNSIVILTPIPSLTKELTKCLEIINKTKVAPGYGKTVIDSLTANIKSVVRGLKHHCNGDNRNHRAFSDEGDYWKITFEGREKILRETDGLKYLGHLLANPGREFPAYKLYELVHPPENTAANPGIGYSEPGQDIIDEGAFEDVTNKLKELSKKRDGANLRSAKRYQKQIDDINKHLPRRDIHGQLRKFTNSKVETARQTVCSAIRRTLEHIQKEHPPLCKHLKPSIHLGIEIWYKTESSTPWIVSK